MSQPYVGQVLLVGFNFAPANWSMCNGAILSIAENTELFELIGITYGGNGQTTFNLPDLQGRIPIHQGSNGVSSYVMGETGGVETVTLSLSQYPLHNHALMGSSNNGAFINPANNAVGGAAIYSAETPATAMNSNMVGMSGGGGQAHNNLQPYLALNWIIALFGIFPSQS
jgi:microcystin-dependent protein